MTDHAVTASAPHLAAAGRASWRRPVAASGFVALALGNAVAIVWLWWHGGNVTDVRDTGELLTSLARITGLLGAYSALLQVLLLARIPALERIVGLDRLSVWHRWNGHACLYLILAHVAFSFYGYALMDGVSLPSEVRTMIGGGVYPGMVTATVGTVLFVVVVLSSIAIAKRRLRYEWWYGVHLTAYAAIALGWFHQVPTGNELVLDTIAADYWASLYLATLGILLAFRVARPVAQALRHRLRVADVVDEGAGVVSLRLTGRGLERLDARGGQFFLWRFLAPGHWWKSHPFSLSESPDGRSLRITVKALGDFTSRIGALPVGTRVVVEGPFGTFTRDARRHARVALIGGGIGITPVRALAEELGGDVVVVYRVLSEKDAVLLDELERLPVRVELVAGDHATPDTRHLLSPDHLLELVPDLADRDVFVCGPPGMVDATVRSLRRAGVPSRNVHLERFAL